MRCGIFSRVSGEAAQVQQFRFLSPLPAALLPGLKPEYIVLLRIRIKYERVKTNDLFLNYDELVIIIFKLITLTKTKTGAKKTI